MLPLRYLGVLHTLGLTYREEGFKGLYRGYIAYVLAVRTYNYHNFLDFVNNNIGAHLSRTFNAQDTFLWKLRR